MDRVDFWYEVTTEDSYSALDGVGIRLWKGRSLKEMGIGLELNAAVVYLQFSGLALVMNPEIIY